jgi:hypothetical protein
MRLIREILRKAEETEVVGGELVQDFQLEEGDRVVGVLPDELRGLYAVFVTASHELDEQHKQLITESEKFMDTWLPLILEKPIQELANLKKEIDLKHEEMGLRDRIAHNRYDTISEMFWGAVRRAFPELIGKQGIGIRKDWQIVVCQDKFPKLELLGIGFGPLPFPLRR